MTTTTAKQPKQDVWLEAFSLFIHDIESPLASMKYLLKLMDEGKLDLELERHRQLVSSSRVAITRAESIIYDIMAVARAGKLGLPVNNQELDASAVIEEAIELSRGSALQRDIEVEFETDAPENLVQADPALLRRALDNLIYNALRHTPAGEKVTVSVEPGAKSVFIHVKDSGPGLGEIDPESLFEKFGQVSARSSGEHRGVGLGLYFCKLAALGMGGTVIAADHPEGGAVFSIKLKKAGDNR